MFTLEGNEIEWAHTPKYLGLLIEDSLTFKPQEEQIVKKLKLKLCFYFRAKKHLVAVTFLFKLDPGDLYMNVFGW